jgi:hypothetical protein
MKSIIIRQIFDEPISGYWDGGAKSVIDWEIKSYSWSYVKTDDPVIGWKIKKYSLDHVKEGDPVIIGSWEANYYFTIKAGKNLEQTILKAVRHIQKITKTKVGYTIRIIRGY